MDVLKAVLRICQEHDLYVDWANDYAEPGYSAEKGIAFSNWNDSPYNRIGDILEKIGVELEWYDEWSICSHCGKAVRTAADSYFWMPYYWMPPDSGELFCGDCLQADPDEYIDSLINNPQTANIFDWLDLSQHGFEKVRGDLESGWHAGMDADPSKIIKEFDTKRLDVVFQLDEQSQFYATFSVWTRRTLSPQNRF